MKSVEAKFELIAPSFLGGKNHEAELRAPSIKGALRFWWRSLNYARFASEEDPVSRMRAAELDLFGSSQKGQSRFLMSLASSEPSITQKGETLRDQSGKPAGPGTRYLGYGLMKAFGKNAGELERSCLQAPFRFTLRIGARDERHLGEILPSLQIFSLLGNLGSRSRKGFGSVNLVELEGDGMSGAWRPPGSEEEYEKLIGQLLDPALGCRREPAISAFSSSARVDLALPGEASAFGALEKYGREMVRYRSWGRNGRILGGEESEKNFEKDHNWSKGHSIRPGFHPERVIFGLPHNYRERNVKPAGHDRRASPLLFHVHRIGDRYIGVASILQSAFLPESVKIELGAGKGGNRECVPSRPEWQVLSRFLDRFESGHGSRTLWPRQAHE